MPEEHVGAHRRHDERTESDPGTDALPETQPSPEARPDPEELKEVAPPPSSSWQQSWPNPWARPSGVTQEDGVMVSPGLQPRPAASQSQPLTGAVLPSLDGSAPQPGPQLGSEAPLPAQAQPVVVAGHYHYLKWWTLVLMLATVWIPAAGVGFGLYYWWFHSFHKTAVVLVVLVYVAVCAVAGLLLAMVEGKPLVAALAIALISAPFASAAGAAPVHGHYYCQHVSRCLAGIIPY